MLAQNAHRSTGKKHLGRSEFRIEKTSPHHKLLPPPTILPNPNYVTHNSLKISFDEMIGVQSHQDDRSGVLLLQLLYNVQAHVEAIHKKNLSTGLKILWLKSVSKRNVGFH